ncbi:hypothetical protein TNCV_4628641 [Trichonephila clavipes]|nr:hypothetical protein TNCV_4628641 [Trichonephila clavipes]
MNKHIEEWLEQGIVRPSSSEYASPLVLVKNKKTYNKKRKKAPEYQAGDLVVVPRTQFGGGLKIRPNGFGSYQFTEVKLETDIQLRNKVTTSPIDGATSKYMYSHGMTGFRGKRLRRGTRQTREKRVRFCRREATFFGQRGGQ